MSQMFQMRILLHSLLQVRKQILVLHSQHPGRPMMHLWTMVLPNLHLSLHLRALLP